MSNECDMKDGEVSAAAAGGKNAALGDWQWDRRFPGGEADLVKVCQNMGEAQGGTRALSTHLIFFCCCWQRQFCNEGGRVL